ncbi:PREDICTED: apoptosis facilitator Bcl-2-like protein 14 [Leptosomus discolor]|uniref:apoptosis facilitator Bcl-2-like protein 14 n=1 Tax=Leptosomus discolor TaxID=188344 RepID=UPI0005224C18|nr:PREDICTED: apoptosis facilitator Bcl-2-like protein 14 [Leptosomus discolor]
MSSPNDVSMEEIPLEDDERDSIEYKILMAYAQRRLSVSKYGKLLKNEANVQKSSSSIRRKINYLLYFPPPSQTGETADVNHIADKLVQLVTSRSQESPSDVSFKLTYQSLCGAQGDSDVADGSGDKEHDEEEIIQTIVSLLRESGDQLEKKIQKDRIFHQHFKDMLSYNFFKRITDLFLKDISGESTSEPGDQVRCTKVAFTMEIATRLTAVDNHPMNLVLGFGLKYLREHFKPWVQDQGGWEKALASLDHEEVE